MAIVAYIMRPWVLMMREMGVVPRVLADDILVTALGEQPTLIFINAFDSTHQYLDDIGAKLAADKSLTFSTNKHARVGLRKHVWQKVQAKIKVVLHARDLGAHLNLSLIHI